MPIKASNFKSILLCFPRVLRCQEKMQALIILRLIVERRLSQLCLGLISQSPMPNLQPLDRVILLEKELFLVLISKLNSKSWKNMTDLMLRRTKTSSKGFLFLKIMNTFKKVPQLK
jgi:hypothetical protein